MIIDFHTHIFPDNIAERAIKTLEDNCLDKAFYNGTANGLIKEMERANVDISITLPVLTSPKQFDSVTNFAISINEKYKNSKRRLISFAGIHPDCENIHDKMNFLKNNGFLGVKIHPDYQGKYIDDDGYIEILKSANDFDMIVITHAGWDYGFKNRPIMCPPELSAKVIDKVNPNKFVLAHFGGHDMSQDVLKFLIDKNVYFDTAHTLHDIRKENFIEILEKHGDDKILFATDNPWCDVKNDIEILKSFKLNKLTEERILYKNALKLLGLNNGN